MPKVKVKVLNAIVDGHESGKVISIEKRSAVYFEKKGFVEFVNKADAPKEDDGDNEDEEKGGE